MNRQLAALSGIAMVLVVLHHTIDLEIEQLGAMGHQLVDGWRFYTLVILHRMGKIAVPLFFFASGGFIAYAARGKPLQLPWQSAGAAIKRLLWPYLIWSGLFYIWLVVSQGEVYTPDGYIKNLLVGYPFHFIPLLIFYYAVAPLLIQIADRFGYLFILLLALYQLLLINLEFPGTLGVAFPTSMALLLPPILGHTLALWAIYFPLGLVYSLNAKSTRPVIERFKWILVLIAGLFFVLDVLHTASVVHFPLAVHIYPLAFLLLTPMIKRKAIPKVHHFELVGKKSYGVYLTHLLVLDIVYLGIQTLVPWQLEYQLAIILPIFVLALGIPLLVMNIMSIPPVRIAYRFAFG